MADWTCPECCRPFGRAKQTHMCAPGLTLDEFFADSHERERPIFDAVRSHLDELGPFDLDPVQVGILFKNGPVFAELRPKKRSMALSFMLPIKLDSPRLSRKVLEAGNQGNKFYHVINIEQAAEIDDQIRDWLTEAYFAAQL